MTCNSSAACCACEAPSYGTVATPPKGGRRSDHYRNWLLPHPAIPPSTSGHFTFVDGQSARIPYMTWMAVTDTHAPNRSCSCIGACV